ncbi:acyltransferase family protein [Paractinoplanes durhamensis]|uniref:Acyltransferase n=1 Tax=Paractinoplanes durhamensis TaxID=113563 RepID=A0ABQ3YN00_9ACTN|nr:acyltransferase family protein [Actinoplanes durhamensis]GID98929.1 acyltransferase [Actinoplanes durhamensis]
MRNVALPATLDGRPRPLPGQRDSLPVSVLPGDRFRPDIEGLRAVAVLLVVAAHAGIPGLAGGYVGVDVFFVISGFLITSLLLREAESTGRISVPRFYARRAMRLLPAAAVVLVATLVAARLLLPLTRLGEFAKDALAATGYVANLRFAEAGTDYLRADQSPSPFQHFWSLAVEEQFYLVWPLLILASAYLWKRRRPLAAVLAVLVVASFALSVTETVRSAPWAYFGPHTRAWELGAGALLALAAGRIRKSAVLGWAGLAAIVAAAVLYDDATAYPGWRALLPVAGAVALIASAGAGPGRPLGIAPLQAVGRLSYGWYLWHWPVLLIVPAHAVWQKALLAVGALGLAWVTYHLVENPLRRRRRPVWLSLGLGAAFSGTVAAAAVLLVLLPHGVESAGRRADLSKTLATAKDPAAELARTIEASRAMGPLPVNLTPKLKKAARDRPRVWDIGCHADTPVTVAPTGCVFGDPNGRETVVLYGDSHAAQWFPAMEKIATERHWRLVDLTKSSCTAADLAVRHDTLKRAYTECLAFHASALARITREHPSLVVIGSSFNYAPAQPATDLGGQWRAAWDRTFGALEATGARVAAIADTPYMGGPVPECLADPANAGHAGNCTRSLRSALRGPEQREVFLAYAGRPRTTVINPITWFCTDVCPAVVGNLLVYRDSNHMTTTYSAALAPLLAARLPG